MNKRLIIIIGILIGLSIMIFSFTSSDKNVQPRNNNVCKKLQGNVLIYLIFTQTKETYNWSEYDIQSTIDSIKIATKWLEERARENNIELKFMVDYFQGDSSKSVFLKLNGTPKKLITNDEGIDEINKWTDKIIKIATKDKKSKERLIANLRDQNRVESVGLFFLVNNYFKTDYSLSFNTETDANIEYSILSSKTPSIIAEEILHLFGAPYLYLHPSTNNKKNNPQTGY